MSADDAAGWVLVHEPGDGRMDIIEAHSEPGTLHVAVSVMLVDPAGNWLVQRRAHTKPLFAGRWANSCCTHPRPDESIADAARRAVSRELGIDAPPLVPAGQFTYRASDPASGMVEHEYDHVMVGRLPEGVTAAPEPSEVAAVSWLRWDQAAALFLGPQGAPWAWTVLDLARTRLAEDN